MMNKNGFTLLEVLVALLIVAIGVLGHAKMQIKSMSTAQRANFAQVANTALLDLAQRMRANSDLAGSFVSDNLTSGNAITSSVNCSLNDCTDVEFVSYELAEWYDHLSNLLPSPRYSITESSDLYTLTIIWDAAKTGIGSGTCDTNVVNSYQCGSVEVWIP